MADSSDPTAALRRAAESFPNVQSATSCNQMAYKAGKTAFLYVGPGPKGVGFKAMFKLDPSMPEAAELAASEPQRYQLGVGHWVTTRFNADEPLPEKLWSRWLKESYAVATR